MATQSRRITREFPDEVVSLKQFLRLPEIKPALGFLGGRIIQEVSLTLPHSLLDQGLLIRIDALAKPRRLGQVLPELRCTFGGESLVPDLSFFARGRLPKDKDGNYAERVFLAPDLAIEIISPGQTIKHLTNKLKRCVANVVRLAWLIQPRRRKAFVFRPGRSPETLEVGGVLEGHDVLPGFALPLGEMFGWLVPED